MRTRYRLTSFTCLLLTAASCAHAGDLAPDAPLTLARPAAMASVGYARPSGWSATVHWHKDPGARRAGTDTPLDDGGLSAGISWKSLNARYHYTISRDFFGIQQLRRTGYLDVGADQPLSPTLTLNLHAGDGNVAGRGNVIWNWRDLKAGLTHRLEGGWVVAFNFTRAMGATSVYERYAMGVPRPDGRAVMSNVARRAIVASLSRKF